ncbi:MAG: hypothetical protein ATN36_00055 [Epulopiscium sp. Nele67-Bin005]|nr:MAG: hypothetical protein ATN36_00055 [Epulopiscium sp. Nele67-Bin005]
MGKNIRKKIANLLACAVVVQTVASPALYATPVNEDIITIPLETLELSTTTTTPSTYEIEPTSTLSNGNYGANISVDGIDSSMTVGYYQSENVNILIDNGSYYLTLVIDDQNTMMGQTYTNIVDGIEVLVNGEYVSADVTKVTSGDMSYAIATIELDDLSSPIQIKGSFFKNAGVFFAPDGSSEEVIITIDESSLSLGTGSIPTPDNNAGISNGEYGTSISVAEVSGGNSMTAQYFQTDNVHLVAENGNYSLSLVIKDESFMGGQTYTNTVDSIEVLTNGVYSEVSLDRVVSDGVHYAIATIELNDLSSPVQIKGSFFANANVVFIPGGSSEEVIITIDESSLSLGTGSIPTPDGDTENDLINYADGTYTGVLNFSDYADYLPFNDVRFSLENGEATITLYVEQTEGIDIPKQFVNGEWQEVNYTLESHMIGFTSTNFYRCEFVTSSSQNLFSIVDGEEFTITLSDLDKQISDMSQLSNGNYTANINIWKETSDVESTVANRIPTEFRTVDLSVENGVATVTLYIEKNSDMVVPPEYLNVDGEWQLAHNIELIEIAGQTNPFYQFEVQTISDTAEIRCMQMTEGVFMAGARIVLNDIKEATSTENTGDLSQYQDGTYTATANFLELNSDNEYSNSAYLPFNDVRFEIADGVAKVTFYVEQTEGVNAPKYQTENLTWQEVDYTLESHMIGFTSTNFYRCEFETSSSETIFTIIEDEQFRLVLSDLENQISDMSQLSGVKYSADINIWKETSDVDSTVANRIPTQFRTVEVNVESGLATVTLYIEKNSDMVVPPEYLNLDGEWQLAHNIELVEIAGQDNPFYKFEVQTISDTVEVRCMQMTEGVFMAGARIVLSNIRDYETPVESDFLTYANGEYKANIDILKETEDETSIYANRMPFTEVDVNINNGIATVSLLLEKNSDMIVAPEYFQNDEWVDANAQLIDIEDQEYQFYSFDVPTTQTTFLIRAMEMNGTVMPGCRIILNDITPVDDFVGGDDSNNGSTDGGTSSGGSSGGSSDDTTTEGQQGEVLDGTYNVSANITLPDGGESVSGKFYQDTNLNLVVKDGNFTLTVVINDGWIFSGEYVPNIVDALEHKVNGTYQSLSLRKGSIGDLGYVTADISFSDINEPIYLKGTFFGQTDLSWMAGGSSTEEVMMVLDTSTLNFGSGGIAPTVMDTDATADEDETEAIIEEFTLTNGTITLTLSEEDEDLDEDRFSATYSINGADAKDLELNNFDMDETTVMYTFEAFTQTEEEQTIVVAVQLDSQDEIERTIVIPALGDDSEIVIIPAFSFKENLTEVAYIQGYGDGTFRPTNTITREEALTMFGRLINVTPESYKAIDLRVTDTTNTGLAKLFARKNLLVDYTEDGYLVQVPLLSNLNIVDADGEKIKIVDDVAFIEVADFDDEVTLYINESIVQLTFEESSYSLLLETETQAQTRLFNSLGLTNVLTNNKEGITREDFTKMLVAFSNPTAIVEGPEFSDISPNHSSYNAILLATSAGFIRGYEDNTFRPENVVTRAEAVTMINRMIGDAEEAPKNSSPFIDVQTSHWAFEDIYRAFN